MRRDGIKGAKVLNSSVAAGLVRQGRAWLVKARCGKATQAQQLISADGAAFGRSCSDQWIRLRRPLLANEKHMALPVSHADRLSLQILQS